MMKIKGTAVRVVPKYIKEKYPELYDKWLESLPPESKEIFASKIYPSHWFPVSSAAAAPIATLAGLLKRNAEDLAFEIGRFSADDALKGVYRIFVTITSPKFLIKRASSIVSTYYDPADMQVLDVKDREVVLKFGKLEADSLLVFHRVQGWVYQLVLITQKSEPQIMMDLINQDQAFYAKFTVKW